MELFAFAIFLLMPGFIPKLIVVIAVNLFNTGWYPILQGRLYSSLPGQSASLMAIVSVTAPFAKFFPFLIGFLADRSASKPPCGFSSWVQLPYSSDSLATC